VISASPIATAQAVRLAGQEPDSPLHPPYTKFPRVVALERDKKDQDWKTRQISKLSDVLSLFYRKKI
jgi:uncharacterized protein (UPF0305 family)